jgi:hypothetical protein
MKAILISRFSLRVAEPLTPLEIRLRRWTTCLLVSGAAGAVVGLCGLAIAAATLTGLVRNTRELSSLGVLSLALSYPLMFAAAHCLDKMDETKKTIGRARHWERTLGRNGTLPPGPGSFR